MHFVWDVKVLWRREVKAPVLFCWYHSPKTDWETMYGTDCSTHFQYISPASGMDGTSSRSSSCSRNTKCCLDMQMLTPFPSWHKEGREALDNRFAGLLAMPPSLCQMISSARDSLDVPLEIVWITFSLKDDGSKYAKLNYRSSYL